MTGMRSLRVLVHWTLLLNLGFGRPLTALEAPSRPVFLYASLAGEPTFDQDPRGGNPFATALVELLSLEKTSFAAFKAELIELTRRASRGSQEAEVVGGDQLDRWQFLPKPRRETWVALVVVFSDYSRSRIGRSLPGAKRDQHRVGEALSSVGFAVTSLLDPDRDALALTLKDFEARTAKADVALIYTTGHGVETDGGARVLLPYARVNQSNALTVTELAKVARAKRANLIFYAACRNRLAM